MHSSGRTFYHHLGSRSPWRRPGGVSLKIPSRESMVSLQIQGLPRANPFFLARGIAAMEAAEEATRRALDQPIGVDRVVCV
jgi:NTE family protein